LAICMPLATYFTIDDDDDDAGDARTQCAIIHVTIVLCRDAQGVDEGRRVDASSNGARSGRERVRFVFDERTRVYVVYAVVVYVVIRYI
jgi:hypothetical protein